MKKRRDRQVSLNNFKPQCDLSPYIETQQAELTQFEKSLLLMKILKKHQLLIFANKEKQVKTMMSNLCRQNLFLERVKNCEKNRKQRVVLSSFKVLEELDVNRKQAYKVLEQQNKEIADRIYGLQLALEKMKACKKSQTLSPEYLQNLQTKLKNRKKAETHFTKLLQNLQQKIMSKLSDQKKQILEQLQLKSIDQREQSIKQNKKNNTQNESTCYFSTHRESNGLIGSKEEGLERLANIRDIVGKIFHKFHI